MEKHARIKSAKTRKKLLFDELENDAFRPFQLRKALFI